MTNALDFATLIWALPRIWCKGYRAAVDEWN